LLTTEYIWSSFWDTGDNTGVSALKKLLVYGKRSEFMLTLRGTESLDYKSTDFSAKFQLRPAMGVRSQVSPLTLLEITFPMCEMGALSNTPHPGVMLEIK
jgi:hypothetical protein